MHSSRAITHGKTSPARLTATGGTAHVGAVGAGDIDGLQLAGALVSDDIELHRLALIERAEALGVDHALVAEELLRAIGGGDESIPLLGVEPLARARLLSHCEG